MARAMLSTVENQRRPTPLWQQAEFTKKTNGEHNLKSRNGSQIHHIASLQSPQTTKAQIFSDLHLIDPKLYLNTRNRKVQINGQEITLPEGMDPTRYAVVKVLQKINEQDHKKQPRVLIFNGDTFDLLRCCMKQDFVPYDKDGKLLDPDRHRKIFRDLLKNNPIFIQELQKYLNHPKNKIVFVTGNHDHLLSVDGRLRDILVNNLMVDKKASEKNQQIVFTNAIQIPALKLHAEHGHLIEEKSHSPVGGLTDCDVLTIVVAAIPNRIIEQIDEFQDKFINNTEIKGSSKERIQNILENLKEKIEDFDVLDIITSYRQFLKNCFKEANDAIENELREKDKNRLSRIIDNFFKRFGSFLKKEKIVNYYLDIVKSKSGFMKRTLLNFASWIDFLTFDFTSNSQRFQGIAERKFNADRDKKCDNNGQIDEAKLLKEEQPELENFAFGHTHKKSKGAKINEDGSLYFNTGQWFKSVISKLKDDGKFEFDQVDHNGLSITLSKAKDGKVKREVQTINQLLAT
jgi:UDP-2,3-diacylglucosamine pyrophosphatase LpxH